MQVIVTGQAKGAGHAKDVLDSKGKSAVLSVLDRDLPPEKITVTSTSIAYSDGESLPA